MRIAVYGGSFNPPHAVHAEVARWLLDSDHVDEVWMVPVAHHAFEGLHAKTLAPFSDRARWCEAMCQDVGDGVRVDRVEAGLPAPSYSIDTLVHLAQAHPEHVFRLVVGADILAQTVAWKDWDRILDTYTPIILGREEHGEVGGVPTFRALSSTDIRARLAAGESIADMVTPSVARCLAEANPWRG